jgi:FAD/FMN-containing dehydrogenase
MPRTMQEILDHADDLAQRFEDYEPRPGDELDVAEYLLRRAALARARSERQVADAVSAARRAGLPWKKIGSELGISGQAAQQRYGPIPSST